MWSISTFEFLVPQFVTWIAWAPPPRSLVIDDPFRDNGSDLIPCDCITFVKFSHTLRGRADTSVLVLELGELQTTAVLCL